MEYVEDIWPQLLIALILFFLILFIGWFFKQFKFDKKQPSSFNGDMQQMKKQMSENNYNLFRVTIIGMVVLMLLVRLINVLG